MSRFCTLVSSSKGNCTYISGGGVSLLVDAGIGVRALCRELGGLDVRPEDISGILLTHEHTDHIKGLSGILRRLRLPLYASADTLSALDDKGIIPAGASLIELSEDNELCGIAVRAFSTPHDAAGPNGFRIFLPDGRSVGIATDLGIVTERVGAALTGCDLVLLESNYDPSMLRAGPYPWTLKRRIEGSNGHLSNEDAADFAVRLARHGTARFVLGHLSLQNNLPEIAHLTTRGALNEAGAREGVDYLLSVAPAFEAHPLIVF